MFVIQTEMVFVITFADALCGFLDRFLAYRLAKFV